METNKTGRKVTVIEAGPEWVHVQYIDDKLTAYTCDLTAGFVIYADQPRYGGPAVVHRAVEGCALVMLSRFQGQDMGVEIVLAPGAIDSLAVQVATDALLERTPTSKRRAAEAVAPCGVMHGIVMALVEARVKVLAKGEAEAVGVAA